MPENGHFRRQLGQGFNARSQKIIFRPAGPQAGPLLEQDTFFPRKTKAPARNADPRRTTFPKTHFPENKSPCWEHRSEETENCFQDTFCQKTNASARNADPRRIAISSACFFSSKTKAPARNGDPRDIAFFWTCFSQKTKAPARNADPREIVFSGHVFLRKQKPLLGTPTRET